MNLQPQNVVSEWVFRAEARYRDPGNEVLLDAVFITPDDQEHLIPAFWDGGDLWRVRYASPLLGLHRFRTVCSNSADAGLHGQEGEVTIFPYEGDNPLYQHGPVRVAANRRHLEHTDGTPFFWLGDTWWMGLSRRLTWPQGFQTLALDRITKGFSVIQIVAGLYPDMPPFDERGANEAGFPWEPEYERLNPAYFRYADRRLQYLVETGLMPCIVGCWGYFLPWMGVEKLQQHWRNLVARYGAYPVVWCLAGEWDMPYYLAKNKEQAKESQQSGWAEVARYLRTVDGFHRLVSIHEGSNGRLLGDGKLIDFEMLQTGHGDRQSLPNTVQRVTEEYAAQPTLPVLNSEVCYEGIGEACRQEVQRLMFWVCLLSGACGHTYGANGIWQVNSRERLYGPSPHGMAWGNVPWEDAYQLPGSAQVGLAKRLLERFPWWKFEPHPEWISSRWTEQDYCGDYAAGIPGRVRVFYLPRWRGWGGGGTKVTALEAGVDYRATLVNPATGEEIDWGPASGDAKGEWELPGVLPIYQDWLLVLDAR